MNRSNIGIIILGGIFLVSLIEVIRLIYNSYKEKQQKIKQIKEEMGAEKNILLQKKCEAISILKNSFLNLSSFIE